ncbi:MAG TPA: hypothetical protein VFY93_07975 [Planctomycetota bacterium]|nr:hypothetical protein [Planctomycetota bacterium]
MRRVTKPLVLVLGLLAAGYGVWTLARRERASFPPAPPAPRLAGVDTAALARASHLEAPFLYRQALERTVRAEDRAELGRLFALRAADASEALAQEIDRLRADHRYVEAARTIMRYATAWGGTSLAARADELRAELAAEQEAQVERRGEEAMALLDEVRFDAAREALRTGWELEAPYVGALEEKAATLERLIRVREYEATKNPAAAVPKPRDVEKPGSAPVPPPLPGAPHPDVKRLAEARALLATARKAFDDRRYVVADRALKDVVGFYGDLRFVARRTEAVTALAALCRHGSSGVAGLFRATEMKRDGERVRLRYTFEKEEELLDWEALQPVPHAGGGSFERISGGVRGTGLMALVLRAFFENDVTIRSTARARELRGHGLVFCQEGLETRFLLWVVANRFFVEGENYVKERPGHSILMFGKGVNNDVPVDSPEIGFIFRGDTITKPELVAGEDAVIAFAARNDTMSGEVLFKGDRGGRSGSALGDDGKGIGRLRPGLIVLDCTAAFGDVIVEGRLHADFERARVNALLDAASALDAID